MFRKTRDQRMAEYYMDIRWVHIAAVIASGSLFFLRGLLLMGGFRIARAAPVRFLSYGVDTVLLTAALMLMTIVRQYPFVHHWLTAKVLLLVVYILLGVLAFRSRGKTRFLLWATAIGVFLFIISVARAHHPLGALL